MVEGSLSHYIEDPYLGEIIKRDPVDEEVDVVIIGGGYGAQLVAVRLQEAGIQNFRILEKGGDFGGTWSLCMIRTKRHSLILRQVLEPISWGAV